MTRKPLSKAIATSLIICGSITLSLAHAQSISVADYNTATSAYEDAYVNGQFNYQDGNQEQSSYNLDLSLDYDRVFSSASRNTQIKFDTEAALTRGSSLNDSRKRFYQASSILTSDQYFRPGSHGSFWYGKAELGARKDMIDPFSKVTAGLGYGRVVNVTPMAKAIRLVESLRERGALAGEPSRAIYQQIAQIIAKEDEYRSRHGEDNYVFAWIEDIEKALQSSMSTVGAIKAYDVLTNERISTRKKGWLARAGVGAVLSDYDGSSSKPALELGLEYHLPVSNKTQFSNETIVTTALKTDENSYKLSNNMTLTYQFSDRVDWENSWLMDYSRYDNALDTHSHALSSAYRYHLSNALSWTTSVKLTQFEDQIDGNDNDELDTSLLMGLTYRLK